MSSEFSKIEKVKVEGKVAKVQEVEFNNSIDEELLGSSEKK